MPSEPGSWRNRSPGNLAIELDPVTPTPINPAVDRARAAFHDWSRLPLGERIELLRHCRERLREKQAGLAELISLEVGKPIAEALAEMSAVIAKFDLTFDDASRHFAERAVMDGPHPSAVRRRPRGPAAVIAPFNFPIHLAHGGAVAYLAAGNTVLLKPSPLAAAACAAYSDAMRSALPDGVFQIVQGWGDAGRELSLHPDVRSVFFTGSVPAGTALARDLAADYSKSLALELGGRNTAIVLADADLDAAAEAVADGFCLTAGQRCNATSRVLVDRKIQRDLLRRMLESVERYIPGDPTLSTTRLGPLINNRAFERYKSLAASPGIHWEKAGGAPGEASGKRGWYVGPAIGSVEPDGLLQKSPIHSEETFAPILIMCGFSSLDEAIRLHDSTPYGLCASIFTRSESAFRAIGDSLRVGNLYWNLPTTLSPSTLPFGGLGWSGNGRPGGRGFIRFAADEQAVQWKEPGP